MFSSRRVFTCTFHAGPVGGVGTSPCACWAGLGWACWQCLFLGNASLWSGELWWLFLNGIHGQSKQGPCLIPEATLKEHVFMEGQGSWSCTRDSGPRACRYPPFIAGREAGLDHSDMFHKTKINQVAFFQSIFFDPTINTS